MNNNSRTYRLAFKLLRFFCPPQLLEEIEGDLLQRFERDLKLHSERKAKRKLLWSIVRFFRPGILLRNKFSFELNQAYMIQSYFKIAYRHLVKSKFFTLINVIGLSVGIVVFFLMTQYVSFETSFDQFHENKTALYRIGLKRNRPGETELTSVKTFAGIRSLLKENFPEVENYTGFYKTPANTGFLFRYNGKIYNEAGGILNVDSAFFTVFPSLLIHGNATSVLAKNHNLIISEAMARKVFGNKNPIGQTLERIDDYDKGTDFIITGVLKDIPQNAHFHGNFIRHINDSWLNPDYWKESFLYTYVTLSKESNPELLTIRINAFLQKLGNENPMVKGSSVFLQPITEIHLSSHANDELEGNGNKVMVVVLAFIGITILGMAWINYVNLEVARFISRLKEVGIRRVIGSKKFDLAFQFFVEYLCLTTIAILVAAILLFFTLPYFSTLTGVPITFIDTRMLVIAGCFFCLGSVIIGIYPVFFLLKLNPLAILKGKIDTHGRRSVRKTLVVIQFTVSIVLIACVFLIREQLDFMRIANKKIELEHVVVLRNPIAYSNQELQSTHNSYKAFENSLLANSSIKAMTSSSAVPGTEIGFSYVNLIKKRKDDPYDPTIYKTLFIDNNYIVTYGLKLIAGQNFPVKNNNKAWIEPWLDKNWTTIILNRSAVKKLGFPSPEDAINQQVEFELFDESQKYEIIGVVEDYHHEAIKKEVFPTIFANNYSNFQQVFYSIKLNSGVNPQQALAHIEKSWKDIYLESPFEFFFVDEYYDQQFKSEFQFAAVFLLFATIAISIACLGILGISVFEVNTRLKEISIRKVLGASVASLTMLLSRSHFIIIIVSTFIAWPSFYFFAKRWLASYPMRIEISITFFLIPLMIVIMIVFLILFFQTIRAAQTNPVDNLKNE